MSKILGVMILLCTVFSSAVYAQDIPQVMTGKYRGDVDANNGDHALELTIEKVDGRQLVGISHFYKGSSGCRHPFPMTGLIEADGSVKIDATKGVLLGCERKFELKKVGSGFEGVLIGPTGTRGVKFSLQQ